jgi:hypothetical protein
MPDGNRFQAERAIIESSSITRRKFSSLFLTPTIRRLSLIFRNKSERQLMNPADITSLFIGVMKINATSVYALICSMAEPTAMIRSKSSRIFAQL